MTVIKRAQAVAGRFRAAAEAPRPDAVVGDVAPVLAGVRRLASSLPTWDGKCIVGRLDDRRRLSLGGLDDIDGVLDTHFIGPWVVLTSGAAGRVRGRCAIDRRHRSGRIDRRLRLSGAVASHLHLAVGDLVLVYPDPAAQRHLVTSPMVLAAAVAPLGLEAAG